ncbi:hypothetical protein NUH30_18690 [Leptospira sp. 85282-16]|uniref:hypothetical protein n=1 Tax=Leptospira sp. 85282-16 TaxID=2971256 RepID=UPI0021C1BF77|nr:hypothetical protein [Leptospira sp. 85282-16]MCT8335720.1 hypothetical protein [Leptospira sp. 85282-16]
MVNTWKNKKEMDALLGIEGSREAYIQLEKVFKGMGLTLENGKLHASIDQSMPLIGVKMELYFKDPNANGLVYQYLVEGSFQDPPNVNK